MSKSRGRSRKSPARRVDRRVPTRLGTTRAVRRREEKEDGPLGWFLPQIESAYTQLRPRGASIAPREVPAGARFRSTLQPSPEPAAMEAPSRTLWVDRLAEYKRRKAAALRRTRGIPVPGAPAIPGARNWLPLGPMVVLDGQTVGNEPIAGRICSVAVTAGGQIVYAAAAAGGVFRSDDKGTSWRSLMDGFDVDPTNFASTSLACGALAIDPSNPDRVFVGTGEGDTHQLFMHRIVNALPAYRGIGPIRTDDGGITWRTEATAANSPTLAGEAFFGLAVDPGDTENVVAATTAGLYQRVLQPDGTPEWIRRRQGIHSSVVVTRHGNVTKFLAAQWGGAVHESTDGQTWTLFGASLPATDVGRIALAVQSDSAAVVYAMVVRESTGGLLAVYRRDSPNAAWKPIANPPDVLPLNGGSSQGSYDVAIAIDPNNVNRVYLGGSYTNISPYPGSVWRADVRATGPNWRFTGHAAIGTHAHADVHWLIHTPGESDELWCGCDGGVFLNRNPGGTGEFAAQNTGLSCLCSNFIAQHPTDPNILFTGLQDNGTARTSGGPMWTHVNYGDGGYCLINWADPDLVLSFVNGRVFLSDSAGETHESWTPVWQFGWATMTQPIVGAPFNPAKPSEANIVAVGAGDMVFISRDFTTSWPADGRLQLPGGAAAGSVFALAFASATKLFIGTTRGQVFRASFATNVWTVTRIDDVAAGPLGLVGLITDIAVDWTDATFKSIYVCFGGLGDSRRVWHFDGTRWQSRSGTGDDVLLDVEHNALAVDSLAPDNVYVGADIGIWHSADRGATWMPLQNGLPDAPVFDLQIHPTQRLLRAATHGRGVYEIRL